MKKFVLLSAIIFLLISNLFAQIVGVSKNGNFIAIDYQGLHFMANAKSEILYEIPSGYDISFTDNELYFYYARGNYAIIHNTADGSIKDSIKILGAGKLKFDDQLSRYSYKGDKYFICNSGADKPFVEIPAATEWYETDFIVDFTRNLAVGIWDKGIVIYNLQNPSNPIFVKVNNYQNMFLNEESNNILVAVDKKTIKISLSGEIIEKLPEYRAGIKEAYGEWFIEGGWIGTIPKYINAFGNSGDHSTFTTDFKNVIVFSNDYVKYIALDEKNTTKEIIWSDLIRNNLGNKLIAKQRDIDLGNPENYKLFTFSGGEESPFALVNDHSMVRGNKYWFANGDTNTWWWISRTDLKNFETEKNYRIESALTYLKGRNPQFGIFNEYRKYNDELITYSLVCPKGYYTAKAENNEDSQYSYAVNKGHERNILAIEKNADSTKIFVNGQVVLSLHQANLRDEYGFAIYGSGLVEADYIMASNVRNDDYYKAWHRKAGLMIDPFMVADFQGHSGVITDVAVSPDGKEVVTCAKDKTIRIWDIKTGENIRTFRSEAGPGDIGTYYRIAISPDKKYIAAGGYFSDSTGYEMGHVRFFDYETGKIVHVYNRLNASIQTLKFSPASTPFKEQMLLIGASNGENHFFRYHHFVNNLINGFADPDYKKVEMSMDKTSAIDYKTNPTHDEFLIVMDNWRFIQTANMNHSNLGEGTTEVEIRSAEQAIAACYSKGGDSIFIVHTNSIDVYNLQGDSIGSIPNSDGSLINNIFAAPDGKNVVVFALAPTLINIKTGVKKTINTGNISPSKEGVVTNEGLYVFAGYLYKDPVNKTGLRYSAPQEIGVVDLKTGKMIAQMRSKASVFEGIAFAPDDKGIVFTKNYSGLEGAKTFKPNEIINQFDFKNLEMKSADPGLTVSNNLVDDYNGKKLERWGPDEKGNEDLGKLRYGDVSIREKADYTTAVTYTILPNGNVVLGTGFSLLLFNQNGEQIGEFIGHSGGIKALALSNNGKQMLSLGQDRIVMLWDITNPGAFNHPIASFVVSADNDWICATNENYYASSKYGVKYMGFWQNRGNYTEADFYPFDQFDLQYNRPDKVLEALGTGDEKLKIAYEKAYEKRLKKYGFSAIDNLQNRRLPYIIDISPSKVVTTLEQPFKVTGCDGNSIDKFSHFNFWINDVQVFPDQPKTDKSELTVEFNAQLTPGKNIITVQPINQKGMPGIKKQVTYFADVKPVKPDLYLVAVGVSEYNNAEMNLRYAAKDASDMIEEMKSAGNFGNINTKLIVNGDATLENIKAAKQFLKQAKPWDVTIIYFAGHGLLSDDLDWYFATADVDFNKPELRGLVYDELEGLFDSIPSRNRLLLLDACHSGEVDKESMTLTSTGNMAANVGARGFKMVKQPEIGLANSFKLMQTLFGNLERGTGAVVISSAGGAEFAFESNQWKNGLFTYCLLNGLKTMKADKNKDGEITVSELRNYVSDEVKRLSNGKQTPTARKENIENDFRVW